MARVKAEADQKKKSLWQKLFFPLHIKLPIEAVGVFLIALTALYVFKNMGPEVKTRMTPSEEPVSEYTAKGKYPIVREKANKPSQSPAVMLSKKDETVATGPYPQKSSQPLTQPPVQTSGQPIYDKEPPVKEKQAEERNPHEKDMLQRSAPAPAGLSRPNELKQEVAPEVAAKRISGPSVKEDISIAFKADIDQAKSDIKEILSNLGGRVVKEEPSSDTIIIIGELDSDNLQLFMRKLKMLGYVKEKTPTPLSDKDKVLIKITMSKP